MQRHEAHPTIESLMDFACCTDDMQNTPERMDITETCAVSGQSTPVYWKMQSPEIVTSSFRCKVCKDIPQIQELKKATEQIE